MVVQDILKIVRAVVDKADSLQHRLYNMGVRARRSSARLLDICFVTPAA